jgi:spermidine synthase
MNSRSEPTPTFFLQIRLLYGLHSIVSLAYEILWIKMIAPYLGMTQAALGVVLACFVSGLALGSLVVSWLKLKKRQSMVTLFVGCQLLLGLWAFILPILLPAMDTLYVMVAPPTETTSHQFWRTIIAAGLLLPPSILIGMVFPMLGEWVETSAKPMGRYAASLYKDGLLCSAIGAAFLPSILLFFLGIRFASGALGLINFGIAWLAISQRASIREALRVSFIEPVRASKGKKTIDAPLYLAAFLLGAVLFIVQICGAQFLWLTVNDTFYAHAILVAEILFFMGLGSLAYSLFSQQAMTNKNTSPYGLLLFSLWLVVWLLWPKEISNSYAFIKQIEGLSSVSSFLLAHGLLIALILAIPGFSAGWVFTAFCEKSVQKSNGVRSSLGLLTAWNYLGSILGSLLATFLFIPSFGLTKTLAGAAAVTSLTAILVLDLQGIAFKRVSIWIGSCALLLLACLLGAYGDVTFQGRAGPPNHQIIFHHEDGAGVTEVFEDRDTGDRRLYTCRLRMEGSDAPRDKVFKLFQGAIPVILHPKAEQVLVIGLGTAMSLAAHVRSDIQRITCVEYSDGVIQSVNEFAECNQNVHLNSKVKIIKQDGRNFARLSRDSYDLIIQDLFFPYQTGTGYLYTIEHYKALRSRLSPGGHVAQWLALHQMNMPEIKSVVKTFQQVFPHSSAWLHGRFLLLYGGEDERIDWPVLKRRLENHPQLLETTAYDFLNFFLVGKDNLAEWSRDAVINTDDNLLIERRTPLLDNELDSEALGVRNMQLLPAREDAVNVLKNVSKEDNAKISQTLKARDIFLNGVLDITEGRIEFGEVEIQRSFRMNPAHAPLRDFMGQYFVGMAGDSLRKNDASKGGVALDKALEFQPQNREALFLKAQVEFEKGHVNESLRLFKKLLELYPNYYQGRIRYGRSLLQLGRRQDAFDQFSYVVKRVRNSDAASYLEPTSN